MKIGHVFGRRDAGSHNSFPGSPLARRQPAGAPLGPKARLGSMAESPTSPWPQSDQVVVIELSLPEMRYVMGWQYLATWQLSVVFDVA